MNIWINGQPADQVKLPNRGLAYGDGLFETIRVHKRTWLNASWHKRRLVHGASRLQILNPENRTLFNELWHQAFEHFAAEGPDQGVVKITLVRRFDGRGYGFSQPSHFDFIVEWYDQVSDWGWQRLPARIDISPIPVSVNPVLAGIKHLNRLDSVLASQDAQSKGLDEALLLHDHQVVEGAMTNVFMIKNRVLVTPPLRHGGVNGVMRERVLQWGHELFEQVSIRNLTTADLKQADGIFLTNAIVAIWPVASLGAQTFSQLSLIDPLTEIARQEFQA